MDPKLLTVTRVWPLRGPGGTVAGVNRYQLYLRLHGVWTFMAEIEAVNHSEAFRKVMLAMKPEHYSCQLRLEQVVVSSTSPEKKEG